MLTHAFWSMATCGETREAEPVARYRGIRWQLLAALTHLSAGERMAALCRDGDREFLGIGAYRRHVALCEFLVHEELVTEARSSEWVKGLVLYGLSKKGNTVLVEMNTWWRSLNPIKMIMARVSE